MRRGEHKAVAGGRGEPFLQPVGDVLGPADNSVVHTPAPADLDEIAHGRILLHPRDAITDALQARHARQFLGGESFIHAFLGEVEIERFRQKRQRIDLKRQVFDFRPLVLRLGFGLGRDSIDEVGHFHIVRIAAETGDLGLEIGVVAPADVDIRIDHEDDLAPACAERFAAAARSGLDDNRMSLRRARHRERTARTQIATLIIQAMHFIGPCEQPARLVLDDRIIFPRVPVAEHYLHELVGPVVAHIMAEHFVAAHVLRLAVVERGDDVPGRAPTCH